MSQDERLVPLTVGEILILTQIIDHEKERITSSESPSSILAKRDRDVFIDKLDRITQRLTEQISKPL